MANLLPCAVEDVTGFGTGIDRTQWLNKCRAIQEGLNLHKAHTRNPLEALQRLGGFEIAALTGVVLALLKTIFPLLWMGS